MVRTKIICSIGISPFPQNGGRTLTAKRSSSQMLV